jgi:hypothetical protein
MFISRAVPGALLAAVLPAGLSEFLAESGGATGAAAVVTDESDGLLSFSATAATGGWGGGNAPVCGAENWMV